MAARKPTIKSAPATASVAPAAAAPTTTAVRNSAIPPRPTTPASSAPAARRSAPTYDQIAQCAYFIWQSGKGGSQDENWFRAERDLRGR
jgi:hypothetical protein